MKFRKIYKQGCTRHNKVRKIRIKGEGACVIKYMYFLIKTMLNC